MSDARTTAVNALLAVDKDDGYSNIVIDKAICSSKLSRQDASLATKLFYGVLERRNTLNYVISCKSNKSGKKLPDFVNEVLRVAVYQILYMDKIPPFAAVNEAVRSVKRSKFSFASGYVNAVLRSVLRDTPVIPDKDDTHSLSVRYSCNEWIIDRLVSDYGKETAIDILASSLDTPTTYLRTNALKCSAESLSEILCAEGIEAHTVPENRCAVAVSGAVDNSDAYKNGMFHVQDISSQTCCEALDVKENMRVLDVCAAPGGKSFTIAELMNGTGEVISRDIHPHRVDLIAKGAERLGLDNISASVGDATVFDQTLGSFDRVLCDVPCSGIGVIRRKPDIKYKDNDGTDSLPEIQYSILKTSAGYLKSGGVMIYSTCTLLKAENENNVMRFLSENPDFEPYRLSNGEYMTTLLPQNGTDGFFFAGIRKR